MHIETSEADSTIQNFLEAYKGSCQFGEILKWEVSPMKEGRITIKTPPSASWNQARKQYLGGLAKELDIIGMNAKPSRSDEYTIDVMGVTPYTLNEMNERTNALVQMRLQKDREGAEGAAKKFVDGLRLRAPKKLPQDIAEETVEAIHHVADELGAEWGVRKQTDYRSTREEQKAASTESQRQ